MIYNTAQVYDGLSMHVVQLGAECYTARRGLLYGINFNSRGNRLTNTIIRRHSSISVRFLNIATVGWYVTHLSIKQSKNTYLRSSDMLWISYVAFLIGSAVALYGTQLRLEGPLDHPGGFPVADAARSVWLNKAKATNRCIIFMCKVWLKISERTVFLKWLRREFGDVQDSVDMMAPWLLSQRIYVGN